MSDATPPRRMRYSYEARCRTVEAMLTGASTAASGGQVGASRPTTYRWRARHREAGWAGLHDRPSTPHVHHRQLSPQAEAQTLAVCERTGDEPQVVGAIIRRVTSTVGKALRRLGRSRLPRGPRPPVVRYERERPGELLHIDTNKLGRFWHVGKRSPRASWQHVHVAVDDHSRLAYANVLRTDRAVDAVAFLERACVWYGEQGVEVEAVMTDNGPVYLFGAWRASCAAFGLRHLRTRPYTPRTNGKAERFIQVLLRT